MKIADLLPQNELITVDGIKPSKSTPNVFVLNTSKGAMAVGAKTMQEDFIDVDANGVKTLRVGAYSTFIDKYNVTWLTSAVAQGKAVDLS